MADNYVFRKLIPPDQLKAMRRSIDYLIPPNGVYEVRLLGGLVASGIFKQDGTDNFEQAVNNFSVWKTDDIAKAAKTQFHITVQQLNPDCLALAQQNKFVIGAKTITEEDVMAYQWLVIDLDPDRRSGISSSDTELQAALDLAKTIFNDLKSLDWQLGYAAMSGNGYHLGYRVDIPVNNENKAMIQEFYTVLADKYKGSNVILDTSFTKPAQLSKLYGSQAHKGSPVANSDPQHNRPHRWSYMHNGTLSSPTPVNDIKLIQNVIQTWGTQHQLPLTDAQTNQVTGGSAAQSNVTQPQQQSAQLPTLVQNNKIAIPDTSSVYQSVIEMEALIDKYNIPVQRSQVFTANNSHKVLWYLDCPLCGHKDASLQVREDGSKAFNCFSQSCKDNSKQQHGSGFKAIRNHYNITRVKLPSNSQTSGNSTNTPTTPTSNKKKKNSRKTPKVDDYKKVKTKLLLQDLATYLGQLPPLTLTSFAKKWGLVTIR